MQSSAAFSLSSARARWSISWYYHRVDIAMQVLWGDPMGSSCPPEQSIMDSPMDEMVQLLWEAKMRGPLFAAPGVRHIVYVDLEQIPLLLVTPRSAYSTTKPKIQTAAQDHTSHHRAHFWPCVSCYSNRNGQSRPWLGRYRSSGRNWRAN